MYSSVEIELSMLEISWEFSPSSFSKGTSNAREIRSAISAAGMPFLLIPLEIVCTEKLAAEASSLRLIPYIHIQILHYAKIP